MTQPRCPNEDAHEPLSVCCGAPESQAEGFCGACHDATGFETGCDTPGCPLVEVT